jgi:hypothetical protein
MLKPVFAKRKIYALSLFSFLFSYPVNSVSGRSGSDVFCSVYCSFEEFCISSHARFMAGRSFDQADWIIGHALQTTIPHRDECKGAPPPNLSPTTDPTATTASAPTSNSGGGTAPSDDGSSTTVAVKSEGGASIGGGGGGLKRDPAWDADWIKLMLYMPQPQGGDELSAIRAWDLVRGHPRRGELDRMDYGAIIDELKPKINCYGCALSLSLRMFRVSEEGC